MEWGGGSWIIHLNALQVQVHDIMKGADPTAHIHVCGGNEREATNGKSARVASGGVERIRGGLFPSSTWHIVKFGHPCETRFPTGTFLRRCKCVHAGDLEGFAPPDSHCSTILEAWQLVVAGLIRMFYVKNDLQLAIQHDYEEVFVGVQGEDKGRSLH